MSRDAKLIHQKNVWMLVLLGCFFAAGLFMNILINRNAMAVQPLLGFVLLLILAGFVWNGRWPTATMLLAIFLLFIYLFVVIWNERSFTSYIFLGLLPLLSLFYQNYTAVRWRARFICPRGCTSSTSCKIRCLPRVPTCPIRLTSPHTECSF